jgi:hypothetical protein
VPRQHHDHEYSAIKKGEQDALARPLDRRSRPYGLLSHGDEEATLATLHQKDQ